MLNKTLEWCLLADFRSGESLLKEVFGASGQQLKKSSFSRAFLNAPLTAGRVVELPLEFVNHREICPFYEGPPVRIIAEDEHYLALHKPPGIHTHSQGYEFTPNLVNWLAIHRPRLTQVNQEGADRGCLWRLDGETSGLVLYAKSDAIYQHNREHFSSAFRTKLYLAVVRGHPGHQNVVEHLLAPYGPKGQQMRVGPTGKQALLAYRTLAHREGLSLVLISLKSGLRHQIRVQMAALGFPLIGDALYGGEKAARMYLHCWRYAGSHGSWQDDEAELFGGFFDLHGLLQVIHDEWG